MKDDIRFTPDGMTMREASDRYKGIKDLQARDMAEVTSAIGEDAKRTQSAAKVTEALRIQLTEAGENEELAAANAAIGGQVYARLADAYQYALPASERKNMFVYAEDVMKRTPLIIERDERGKVTGVSVNDNILLHPMNEGVDRNKTVTGTVVPNSLSRQDIDDAKRGTGFVDTIIGSHHNFDMDKSIWLSKTNFRHAVNSAANNDNVDFKTSIKILKQLPLLIQRAVLIETHEDRHKRDDVKKYTDYTHLYALTQKQAKD